jgi:tetratricopeptide (TPR) repeat protein
MSRRVFVSYSHAYEGFIEELLEKLHDADFEVWTDKQIPEGDEWVNSIDKAIQESFAVIVIITPEAMNSSYVTYEWSMAIGLGLKVLPILLEDTPEIHPKLEKIQYLDFRKVRFKWDTLRQRLARLRDEFISTPRALSTTAALLNEARREFEANNYGGARQTLELAQTYSHDTLLDNVYYTLALVHSRLSHENEAEEYLQRALQYNPRHVESLIYLGSLHRRQADRTPDVNKREKLLADAETRFREVLDLQPDMLDGEGESVWGSLGGVLKRRGKVDEAILAYTRASNVKRSSYPYNNLGLLYLEKGDKRRMQENFKLVELFTRNKLLFNPADEWVHNDHFVAKIVLENTKEAEEALSTLLMIAPEKALHSLNDTLKSLKAVKGFKFKPEVKRYITYAMQRVIDRITELKQPIEV